MLVTLVNSHQRVYTASSLPMVHLKDSTKYLINPDTLINGRNRGLINKVLSKLEHLKAIQTVYAVVNNIGIILMIVLLRPGGPSMRR